jgi:soluble lytic murein transglycosylase-like protein
MSFLTKSWIIPVLVVVLTAGSLGFGLGQHIGTTNAVEVMRARSQDQQDRDTKIMAVIVRKNPAATIKDFSNFPEYLVDESGARGLDYRYVMALIDKESEWNPKAVSAAGAIGLMQIMPSTAAIVVKNNSLTGYVAPGGKDLGSLGEPQWNVRIGTLHLKGLIDQYGLRDPATTLRAYNRGDTAARQHWAGDRYAEDVALKFVALSMEVPR